MPEVASSAVAKRLMLWQYAVPEKVYPGGLLEEPVKPRIYQNLGLSTAVPEFGGAVSSVVGTRMATMEWVWWHGICSEGRCLSFCSVLYWSHSGPFQGWPILHSKDPNKRACRSHVKLAGSSRSAENPPAVGVPSFHNLRADADLHHHT
jgi:hypothetical protein